MMIIVTLLIDKKTLFVHGSCDCYIKSEYDGKGGNTVATMPSVQPLEIPNCNFAAKLPIRSFHKWGQLQNVPFVYRETVKKITGKNTIWYITHVVVISKVSMMLMR